MIKRFSRFLSDETGTVAMEYALIATIVSIIAIASMIAMGGSVSTFFFNALSGFSR
jgi:Flp pilus assembly pilin Flp